MRGRRSYLVALLLTTPCLTLACATTGRRAAAVKRALQAQHDAAVKADRWGNPWRILAMKTSDFTATLPDGEPLDRERMADSLKRRWEILSIGDGTRTVVDSVRLDGRRAIAYTSERFDRTVMRNLRSVEIVTNAVNRELWESDGDRWRQRHVDVLRYGPRTANGRPWPVDTVGYGFARVLWRDGAARARELYAGALKDSGAGASQPAPVPISETFLEEQGRKLVRHDRLHEAIRVLGLNVDAHPRSWRAYDALADAYALANDRASAVLNYRRSLELNPADPTASVMLADLGEPLDSAAAPAAATPAATAPPDTIGARDSTATPPDTTAAPDSAVTPDTTADWDIIAP
jgi:hypothetical protein